MPDKAIIERWVHALESGEFPQGKGSLRMGEEYCCLGVLCELAARDGVIPPAELVQPDGDSVYKYDDASGFPSQAVCEWVGITAYADVADQLVGTVPGQFKILAGMNDQGAVFTEIAAHIRKTWLEDKERNADAE